MTRCRLAALAPGLLLSTLSTVAVESPQFLAMSETVAFMPQPYAPTR